MSDYEQTIEQAINQAAQVGRVEACEKAEFFIRGARNIKTPYDNGTLYGDTTEYIPVVTVMEILEYIKTGNRRT